MISLSPVHDSNKWFRAVPHLIHGQLHKVKVFTNKCLVTKLVLRLETRCSTNYETEGKVKINTDVCINTSKALRYTRVTQGSLSFTCQRTRAKSSFTPQPQSVATHWLVLYSHPAEGRESRRLSWPDQLAQGYLKLDPWPVLVEQNSETGLDTV